jgi:putative ATP-dependent endonuclease of the OLD family
LTDEGVGKLIERTVTLHGDEPVNEHIKSASNNAKDLASIRAELVAGAVSGESRDVLGKAARSKKAGWFKSVTWMEDVARDIVGPDLENAEESFRKLVAVMLDWAVDDAGSH